MPHQRSHPRHADRVLLLFLLGLFLFASPFTAWWMELQAGWYLPYLLWLLPIGLAAWLNTRGRDGT